MPNPSLLSVLARTFLAGAPASFVSGPLGRQEHSTEHGLSLRTHHVIGWPGLELGRRLFELMAEIAD